MHPPEDPPEGLASIGRHPGFPERVRIVIEQPRNEPYRIAYEPARDAFVRTGARSLLHARGFSGAYGWIAGTGAPPGRHFDALLVTRRDPRPGEVLEGLTCGAFFRSDGDHKFVALDPELWSGGGPPDLRTLPPGAYEELVRLYPGERPGEGWRGREEAVAHLRERRPTSD